ncbi:MAG TPA: hypothetical protein PK431_13035 [Chitinophagales bacterium]|nr:hypothetical protein [Chitinophagales bacterium]
MNEHSLQIALEDYISSTKKNNYKSIVNYLYSGIFKIVPKKEITKQLKNSFKDDVITNYIDTFSIHSMSPIFNIDNYSFSKIKYYLEMKIDRHEDVLTKIIKNESINYDEHTKDMKQQIRIMLKLLKSVYGDSHVKYDKENDEFRIWQLNTMLAIYEDEQWKFIRWMSGSVYKRIFPEGIVKKLATKFYLTD